MGIFDFLKKNNNMELNIKWNIPEEIYEVRLFEYDKNEALKIFLVNLGESSEEIKKIINSKFPFDSAWKKYNVTTGLDLNEYIIKLKLLVMEEKINNEISSALLLQIAGYLFDYIAINLDLELPMLNQLPNTNKFSFIKSLNENDSRRILRSIDSIIFDALAYYSTRENKKISLIYNEMIEIINLNEPIFSRYWNKLGNKDLWFGIIGKIIEMAYSNYKPTLNKINVNSKSSIDEIEINNEFYDFSNLQSIIDYPNNYYLEGSNRQLAIKDINKVLNIYNNYIDTNKNQKLLKPNIKNLVEARSYNNKLTNTFSLNYEPYTPTGRLAKNVCSVIFTINLVDSPFLKNGIMYDDDYTSSQYNMPITGNIIYTKEGKVAKFSINNDILSIEGKDLDDYNIENLKINNY